MQIYSEASPEVLRRVRKPSFFSGGTPLKLPRPGIQARMLIFSGTVILLVLGLELFAWASTRASSAEFEERIAGYHALHRLRVGLAEHRSLADRYLRERVPEYLQQIQEGSVALQLMASELEPFGKESLAAYFEAKATQAGIDAYLPLVSRAIQARDAGESGYYTIFTRAERIASFTDTYLTKLLSLAMEAGDRQSRQVAERAAAVRRASLAGVIAAGLLSLVFTILFATSITAPIRHLAHSASQMAAGSLDVEPVQSRTGDEIEVLASSFNSMSANIRSLVEGLREKAELEQRLHDEELSVVTMGKALREAQFMNLQDQMRPHFLFNALNTIARSARAEKSPVTEGLASGLARFLRYTLTDEGAFVPLERELGIATEYLSFQKVRFGDRLVWTIHADEETYSFLVPRFSIQPVVENSVHHGIEPRVGGGKVAISARIRGGRLRILIADTGVGMEKERLAELRTAIHGPFHPSGSPVLKDGRAGIGLANLHDRLAYRYGDTVTVSLASQAGRGTVVRISIPIPEEEINVRDTRG